MIDAARFYESAADGLGGDFLDDIQHAIDSIRTQPEVGSPVAQGFRRTLVRRFPYSIIYVVEPGQIVVAAIAHQRRRPGFWQGRSLI